MDVKGSYTAASAAPAKLYRDADLLLSIRRDGRILPRHVQIAPTNQCNANCPWCSCAGRDKRDSLSEHQLMSLVDDLEDLGTRAVTITGGGEPLLHPSTSRFVGELWAAGIAAGLVTNGIDVRRLAAKQVARLSWCRVSFSDTRDWSSNFERSLEYLEKEGCPGLAFSYVLTREVRAENLTRVVRHAVEHHYTHVRVVDDILAPSAAAMERADLILRQSGLPLDRVIFQPRQHYTAGAKRCLISLLKPLIAPDGYLYPCCGVQYALTDETSTFPKRMRMALAASPRVVVEEQQHFNGSICSRCFYSGYNEALAALTAPLDHEAFV